MRFTVVVVAWNGAPWIESCLESILDQDGEPNIVLVDNASTDDTLVRADRVLQKSGPRSGSCTVLCLERNYGFPAGANRGMAAALAAEPDWGACSCSTRTLASSPGALAAFARFLEHNPTAGALGAKILFPDREQLQHAGGHLVHPRMVGLHYGHHEPADCETFNEARAVDYVTGAAIMLRTECLRDLGLFEELFSPGYYEDVELCERLVRHGWSVFYVPEAVVVHEESSSFTDRDHRLRLSHRNRLIFTLRHILKPAVAGSFLQAETDFLANDAHRDEVRAISGAALDLLMLLPTALRMRLGEDAVRADDEDLARRTLVALREACRDLLVAGLPGTGQA